MKLRKWIPILMLATGLLVTGVACSGATEQEVVPPTVSSPNETLVTYAVTGMTCSNCEGHLRDELSKLPNVKTAVASHKKEKAWMIVDGEAPSREAVEKAVKAAGDYKLGDAS